MRGWSVNVSDPTYTYELELPTKALWDGNNGAVIELVFWLPKAQRWVHYTNTPISRRLPEGHIQASYGDLNWVKETRLQCGLQPMMQALEARG